MSIWDDLAKPFTFDEIEIKVQSTNQPKTKALPVAYFDARLVTRRLDKVLGHANWEAEYEEVFEGPKIVGVRCTITVKDGENIVRRRNIGIPTQIEALKGAYSDALKRAFSSWNDHLYHIDLGWHPYEYSAETKKGKFTTQTVNAIRARYDAQIAKLTKGAPTEIEIEDEYNDETPAGVAARGVDAVKNRLGIKEANAMEYLLSIGFTMPDVTEFKDYVNGSGDWAELVLRGKASSIQDKAALYAAVEKVIRL